MTPAARRETSSPGSFEFFEFEIYGFLAQIGVCWAAFLLLPCAVKKGARHYGGGLGGDIEEAAVQQPAGAGSGGGTSTGQQPSASAADEEKCFCGCCTTSRGHRRLRTMLAYDMVVTVAVIIPGLVFMSILPGGWENPHARQVVYWLKTLYGFLSLPWLIFKLPFLSSVLTHVKPTAYDEHGRCCRVLSGSEKSRKRTMRIALTSSKDEDVTHEVNPSGPQ